MVLGITKEKWQNGHLKVLSVQLMFMQSKQEADCQKWWEHKLRTRIEAHSFLKLAIIILHANGWRFSDILVNEETEKWEEDGRELSKVEVNLISQLRFGSCFISFHLLQCIEEANRHFGNPISRNIESRESHPIEPWRNMK